MLGVHEYNPLSLSDWGLFREIRQAWRFALFPASTFDFTGPLRSRSTRSEAFMTVGAWRFADFPLEIRMKLGRVRQRYRKLLVGGKELLPANARALPVNGKDSMRRNGYFSGAFALGFAAEDG